MAIPGFPATTDDSGNGISGTLVDRAFWLAVENAISLIVHGAVNTTESADLIIDEVVEARGSTFSLNDRINGVIAADGSLATFIAPPFFDVGSGASQVAARPAAAISGATGSVGGAAGISTPFFAFTAPANALDQTGPGRHLWIRAWGTFAANANAKTITFNFGVLSVAVTGNFNNVRWEFDLCVSLTGSAAAVLHGMAHITGVSGNVLLATGAINPAIDNVGDVSGTGVANGDVVGLGMTVEVF